MAQLSPQATPEEYQELSQLQQCYRAELMEHASTKTWILDNADIVCQTQSRNSRIRWENERMQEMIKDVVMGVHPRDAGKNEMPEDDSEVFMNFIAELVKGVLQEDDSIALELAYIAMMAQQPMEANPRPPSAEAGQAWASLACQDAVREGSRGSASGSSGSDLVDGGSPTAPYLSKESRVSFSGGAYKEATTTAGRQPTMAPQPKGSKIVLQTTFTPQSVLQQTQPSLPQTRMTQKDVEGDVKSTSKKIGSNGLPRKGTVTKVATPFPVGRISSPTSSVPVEEKPDVRSQGKESGKCKKQSVAVPLPVGPISPPTSLSPAVELKVPSAAFPVLPAPLLSATPLVRVKDPLPNAPPSPQGIARSSGACPEVSSASVPLDPERGSISNVYADGQIPETLASSLGDIPGHITTVVIQHIPGQILQSQLMQMWPASNIGYNMLYAPLNQRKKRSMGFAFMNFTTHSALLEFHRSWHGVVLAPDSKGLSISAADVQGLEANIQLMVGSKLIKSIKRTRHMPLIVEADGSLADFRKFLTRAMHDNGGSQKGLDSVMEEEKHDESMEDTDGLNRAGASDATAR